MLTGKYIQEATFMLENGDIIYDKRRLAAYTVAEEFCSSCGYDERFFSELWEGIIMNPVLYDEFMYYLQKSEFTGNFSCEGYTVPDLYFYHLREFNLYHDTGKNPGQCDKDELAFRAFHTMGRLLKEPQKYIEKLSGSMGMDFY